MNISNKFLASLLAIIIAVTLFGTIYSVNRISSFSKITGFGSSGDVDVTITEQVTLNVTATACDFGSGYVTAPADFAILASNNTVTDWTGSGTDTGLEVRNDGNTFLEINVTAGKTASTLLGGTSSEYKLWSADQIGAQGEADSCASGEIAYPGTSMGTGNYTMCENLSMQTGSDELAIGCYLKVPDDATATAKSDTLTFTATKVV